MLAEDSRFFSADRQGLRVATGAVGAAAWRRSKFPREKELWTLDEGHDPMSVDIQEGRAAQLGEESLGCVGGEGTAQFIASQAAAVTAAAAQGLALQSDVVQGTALQSAVVRVGEAQSVAQPVAGVNAAGSDDLCTLMQQILQSVCVTQQAVGEMQKQVSEMQKQQKEQQQQTKGLLREALAAQEKHVQSSNNEHKVLRSKLLGLTGGLGKIEGQRFCFLFL
jgi:Sec-independent protein translocase protein TatA